jgi:GNAT superfamily N-acetyltransferase
MYADSAHPDGSVVDTTDGDPALALVVARADAGTGALLGVLVTRELALQAPALWYVVQPELDAKPPAMNIVAFATNHRPDGIVVDQDTFTKMPVRSTEQVAAIRWWHGTGQIHQIYVAPTHRRRGIGTKLLLTAGGLRVVNGWAPLWGGGERTDLGEAYIRQGPDVVRGRVTPRTKSLPPMTPENERLP